MGSCSSLCSKMNLEKPYGSNQITELEVVENVLPDDYYHLSA